MLDFNSQNKISAQTQIVATKVTMKKNKGQVNKCLLYHHKIVITLCFFGMISNSFPEFVHVCFGKICFCQRLLAKMIKWHRIHFNLCWLRLSPIIREEQPGKFL